MEEKSPLASGSKLPAWYAPWTRQLAESYFSGTTSMFVLHGNVHDVIPSTAADGTVSYSALSEFLAAQVFGSWDVVLQYDLGRGLRPLAAGDKTRLQTMVSYLSDRAGSPAEWPRDPDKALAFLDRLIESRLLDNTAQGQKSIAILFDYAQYLTPTGDLNAAARGQGERLVRLLSWAQNPYIKRVNLAFCLIADKLAELNARLVDNPHVASIEVPLPQREERLQFARNTLASTSAKTTGVPAEQLAEMSAGLSLVSFNVVLSQVKQEESSAAARRFGALKKGMIERQCQGLVEFVEPRLTLDLVVGQQAAKERLEQDARWLGEGKLDTAPMGYLVCGPVGTGKTFLAECFAGSIGIPCVTLKNFRSKYVGETEGNLEQVLTVLRSLGPVIVIVDEADAALGNRQSDGDSGTSSRVFSMIASQMGNTRYRGRIVWMLLTCRPDLLPIDLKRQGRAEVHLPLFYPQSEKEVHDMFRAMSRKNKITLPEGDLPPAPNFGQLSGADLESILLSAQRKALTLGQPLTRDDLASALTNFVPSIQGLEKEMQELAAVLECTELGFLPPSWRERVSRANGRSELQERYLALRQLVESR